jgi:hypothetical protein
LVEGRRLRPHARIEAVCFVMDRLWRWWAVRPGVATGALSVNIA